MEYSKQGYRSNSRRPRFLSMISPRTLTNNPSKVNQNFELYTKTKPTTGIDMHQYNVRIWTSDPSKVLFDKQHEVLLLLYGEIYNTAAASNQLNWLTQEYVSNGLEFAKKLNGSFVIVLVDKRKDCVAVVTDRVNSRRAFHSVYEGSHWVSNCLYSHPLTNVNLDHIGVAWYLVNKTVFNNRTLFEGVRILERASIHEMKSNELYRRQYWNYKFDYSYEGIEPKRLKVELTDILVESVRRRIKDGSKVFLSLSGGYDSTAILGILRYKLHMDAVQCFSYIHSRTPSKNGDAYIAHKMANIAGYKHRMVQGYDGDIFKWINLNGRIGNGTASTCGEIDALIELFDQSNLSHKRKLFIGDGCFGHSRSLEPYRDVLDSLEIHNLGTNPVLSEFMEPEMCRHLQEGLEKDRKAIITKYPGINNLHDLHDLLYLDQRLSNYLLPHKEYFMGDFITVSNPFLDNDVLAFRYENPLHIGDSRGVCLKRQFLKCFPSFSLLKELSNKNSTRTGVKSSHDTKKRSNYYCCLSQAS